MAGLAVLLCSLVVYATSMCIGNSLRQTTKCIPIWLLVRENGEKTGNGQ